MTRIASGNALEVPAAMTSIASGNALLQSLSACDLELLRPDLELVELKLGQTIYEMDDPVDWVIFPEVGLLSMISIMASGDAIETSIVGREGGVGFVEALGSGVIHSRLIVQVPGQASRIKPERYRKAFEASESLRRAVHSQVELLLAESRQAIACHSLHRVEPRFSRWLLECQDLSGGLDHLPLKQEFLAVMLGVRRTTVTQIAKRAQKAGMIRYSRGMITIVDREALEESACECRATLSLLRQELEPEQKQSIDRLVSKTI